MITLGAVRRVVDRLTADAHNETGSVREYARSLLADLGVPAPAEPEAPRVAAWCANTWAILPHKFEAVTPEEFDQLAVTFEMCSLPADDPIHEIAATEKRDT